MSICFVTHEDFDNTAVANAMMADLARELKSQLEIDISILSASKKSSIHRKDNFNHQTFKRSRKGYAGVKEVIEFTMALAKAFQLIKKSKIVIFRSYPSIFMFGLIAKVLRKTIIFDTRGLWCEELVDSGKIKDNSQILTVLNFFEAFWLKHSNIVICVTKYQRDYYQRRYSIETTSHVIGNGAKTPLSTKDIRKENELNLIYAGSLIKWHCIDLIRDICCELGKRINLSLTLLTKQKGLANELFKDVEFKTIIQEQNFRVQGLKGDYAFCLYKGGISKEICYPVKLNEYLANDNKIIASHNVKVHRDIVNSDNGILVKLEHSPSKIASQILDDHSRRSNKTKFDYFTYDQQVKEWLKILKDLI